jgi:hypothetical protein
MAISKQILDRLKALEDRAKLDSDIFIYADGHRETGDLYNFIDDIANEGAGYLNRKPQNRVVDFQPEDDEDGLCSAIFKAVMKSLNKPEKIENESR